MRPPCCFCPHFEDRAAMADWNSDAVSFDEVQHGAAVQEMVVSIYQGEGATSSFLGSHFVIDLSRLADRCWQHVNLQTR